MLAVIQKRHDILIHLAILIRLLYLVCSYTEAIEYNSSALCSIYTEVEVTLREYQCSFFRTPLEAVLIVLLTLVRGLMNLVLCEVICPCDPQCKHRVYHTLWLS